MPITDHQRELRRKHIGSSDTPAILGLSPYKTAWDIWADKTGMLEDREQTTSEAADIGNMIEGVLLDWASDRTGLPIVKNQYRVHADGILSASHDALAHPAERTGYEAKTAGIVRGWVPREEWGAEGTDEVPDRVMVQCMHQMIVSGLDLVWVPALLAGRGRVLYRVDRNQELCDLIMERCIEFWGMVQSGTPPSSTATLDVAKHIRRVDGKRVTIPATVVSAWRMAKEKADEAKAMAEAAEAEMLRTVGDAQIAESEAGVLTIKPVKSVRLDTDAFRTAHADLFKQFSKSSSYNRLTFKAAKKEEG